MFEKVLIAARGDSVLRIARTCERLGVATVAIHSDGEPDAPHATGCDQAISVGGTTARDSYLNASAIIAAAQQTGAQAIHPGCGPLARSAAFARAVADAGLTLIGAAPEVLERVADVPANRELARLAGVRPLASEVVGQNGHSALLESARAIGYPLLVCATGDGAVVELVEEEHELTLAIGQCRDRAIAECNDARIHLEQAIDRPRLLAVLVIADARGECIALGELERCADRAIAARILLDESPAPALVALPGGSLKRDILWDAAARLAKEAGLVGPGTAEFLLDAEARLSFTRLHPGLPEEHALVEMRAGLDLVEAQLRIAAGERLPAEVRRVQPSGNAAQARLRAEGPRPENAAERPVMTAWRWPTLAPGTLRVESDLAVGAGAATDYDPVVAHVTGFGQTRHQALLTLDRALAEATIEPLATNLALLRLLLAYESYRAGQYDTGFLERSEELRGYT